MKKDNVIPPCADAPERGTNAAKSAYNHVMKSTGLLGGIQAFYILMSVVRNKLTAMLIGEAGIGIADLYCRTIELLGNTTNFGVAFSAVRRLSALYEKGDRRETVYYVRLVRTWTFLLALFGTLVCIAFSPLLSRYIAGDHAHTLHFCLLAPAVGFTTLSGGEAAILKGMRRLRQLALITTAAALGTVIITVPIYLFFGFDGIIPVIVGTTALNFILNLRASAPLFPYRISPHRRHFLRQGGTMIRLGSAYIAAGIIGSAAELFIRTFVVDADPSYRHAGLYAAGLTLTVSYARLIFVAMDADYFPRLSAGISDRQRTNTTVNQQIDILVLLMAPFLILFAIGLPFIIPLLYTPSFLEVTPMVLCALPYMFFKAIYSPIAYLSLAAGRSRLYLTAELIYYVAFALLVTGGYRWMGLTGAGLGLSAANLIDLTLLPCLYGRLFGFRFAPATLRRCLIQALLLGMALACCGMPYSWAPWAAIPLLLVSTFFSWRFLQRETTLCTKITGFFRKKQ